MSRLSFISGGTPRSVEDDEREERERLVEDLRVGRLRAARENSNWTEVDAADLVEHGPKGAAYLVSSTLDHFFMQHRGTVFVTGQVTLVADRASLYFYVDPAGELVFLDRQAGTWTERLERIERRRLRVAR